MKSILNSLIIIALIGFTTIAKAQTAGGKIKGQVIDSSQKAIGAATISLLNAKDSSVVKFLAADKTGNYQFENIPAGRYIISVSAVGHNKGYSEIVEIKTDETSNLLKTIELIPQPKGMAGVT